MFKSIKQLFTLILIALAIAVIIIVLPSFEWNSPEINFLNNSEFIGLKPFEIEIEDKGKGLKSLKVYIGDDSNEMLVIDKKYESNINNDRFEIDIKKNSPLKEGKVKLKIISQDNSKFNFFRGNKTTVEKNLILDLTPPKLNELSTVQYLKHGGSGFLIYKSSKDLEKSGVKIRDYLFPGYSGYFQDPSIYIVFFAYPYDMESNEELSLYAVDKAGNERTLPVFYHMINAKYRDSTINVDEMFIKRKMLPLLDEDVPESETMLKDIFLKVNNKMRTDNNNKIMEITANSKDKMFWNNRFLQLSNSKVEANFADHRSYKVDEEIVDKQYHLGYDLSVTKKYPVEAANGGIIEFTGDIGIYGNTVIVDHGMGVMTLYSHLSSISVKEGDKIKKGGIIGKTGITGLAVGDHLHFGVYVHGVPVRPLEWWDQKWIKEKVLNRIEKAKSEYGE